MTIEKLNILVAIETVKAYVLEDDQCITSLGTCTALNNVMAFRGVEVSDRKFVLSLYRKRCGANEYCQGFRDCDWKSLCKSLRKNKRLKALNKLKKIVKTELADFL